MIKKLLPLFLAFITADLAAAIGDTTHVITHNQQLVVTNPNTGWNEYANWGTFPAAATSYRKVIVTMSYKCPTAQNCGEWDYIDQIWLRRKGSIDSTPLNLEMVRFITPYGNSFTSSWQFQWHCDITDWAPFLHDSVEVGYVHTGYETNVGRGWIVTLDFALIEGTPARSLVTWQELWNTSHVYGDVNNPIDNALQPDTVVAANNVTMMRARINHTGHGYDANECSEFCVKYRDYIVDGNQVDRWYRWRLCGANALYPQGGTWVYNRGNWCPGAVVYPTFYQTPVAPASTHVFDVDMEPYTTGSPSANEYIVGYLFQYTDFVNANDASMEEVLRPSTMYEYGRQNAACANPEIVVRNNGSTPLTNLVIKYGYIGQPEATYTWSGSIAPDALDTIVLPGVVIPAANNSAFKVYFQTVNAIADQYPTDDTIYSRGNITAGIWEPQFVFEFRTNNEASENWYNVYDDQGNVVFSRAQGTLTANTTYRDTFNLPAGCYRLVFSDYDAYGGDGLSFWANTGAGNGWLRLKRVNGQIVKNFSGDFGAEIDYSFTIGMVTGDNALPAIPADAQVYPNPSGDGQFNIDVAFPSQPEDLLVEVFNAEGQLVQTKTISAAAEGRGEIDLGNQPAGVYLMRINGATTNAVRKVVKSE